MPKDRAGRAAHRADLVLTVDVMEVAMTDAARGDPHEHLSPGGRVELQGLNGQ